MTDSNDRTKFSHTLRTCIYYLGVRHPSMPVRKAGHFREFCDRLAVEITRRGTRWTGEKRRNTLLAVTELARLRI